MTSPNIYRRVAIGTSQPNAVTVGIEANSDGGLKAAVWWESKGDLDADEAEFDNVPEALRAAEASRVLHGFAEVVVALQDGLDWQPQWGRLSGEAQGREPLGDMRDVALSESEISSLAEDIETERDA